MIRNENHLLAAFFENNVGIIDKQKKPKICNNKLNNLTTFGTRFHIMSLTSVLQLETCMQHLKSENALLLLRLDRTKELGQVL
jgi:hypothetical protein